MGRGGEERRGEGREGERMTKERRGRGGERRREEEKEGENKGEDCIYAEGPLFKFFEVLSSTQHPVC